MGTREIVTGANGGFGWQTPLELARTGAEVTIAPRDAGKVAAANRIRAALPTVRIRRD
jgi:NAD(P)-dependent dehydrogenase (short-subunit alcohol dehydrogenase family)